MELRRFSFKNVQTCEERWKGGDRFSFSSPDHEEDVAVLKNLLHVEAARRLGHISGELEDDSDGV